MYSPTHRDTGGVDILVILVFIATGFVYLLAGLFFFLFSALGILNVDRDAVFVLWLFGFVAMMIFGLSYMFASGLSRDNAFMKSTVSKEYVFLNFGISFFFSGFSGFLPFQYGHPFAVLGLILIIISVFLHLLNLLVVVKHRSDTRSVPMTFADDY